MPKRIEGQVIVITGASSGIGLATAQAAARSGARVVMAARNAGDLHNAADDIRREGGEAIAVQADVAVFEQVELLANRAIEEFGRIDTWVNCAAVSAYATFVEQPLEDIRRIMDVNFLGQVHGAKAALPHLEQSAGALICVGSTLSDRGVPLQGAYCASKHALKGWLDSLRVELQHAGSAVRVTLVKPSSVNTPLFNKAKTQLGVMPQPIPPVYEPELAARVILRAAAGDERDAFVGGAGKFLSITERLSPRLVDVQQRLQGFDSQMTTWAKGADAPSNLYDPVAHDGGVRGDFTRTSHRRSAYQAVEADAVVFSLLASSVLVFGAQLLQVSSQRRFAPAVMKTAAAAFAGKALLTAFYEG
ncbi:MAG TPA: SDR family oxidoreductase [Longimicrobiales bacterium]|nr:SDR family oxidoreductase [Longimicrobiales bacterium]